MLYIMFPRLIYFITGSLGYLFAFLVLYSLESHYLCIPLYIFFSKLTSVPQTYVINMSHYWAPDKVVPGKLLWLWSWRPLTDMITKERAWPTGWNNHPAPSPASENSPSDIQEWRLPESIYWLRQNNQGIIAESPLYDIHIQKNSQKESIKHFPLKYSSKG